MPTVGEKLMSLKLGYEQRTGERLTGEKLGQALGISQVHANAILSGSRNPSTALLVKLSRFFGVTTDSLLSDSAESATLAEFDKAINPEVPRNIRPEDSAISLLGMAYTALRSEYGEMPPSDKSAVEGLVKAFVLLVEEKKI